jgi:hypothetical protein
MHRERFQQIARLFEQACELAEDERSLFLSRACGDDADLKAEVESLLSRDAATQRAMPTQASSSDVLSRRSLEPSAPEALGSRIGHYEIRGVIGTGGMGTVYEAVQDDPRRLVALKLLRSDAASRSAMKRFRHEAEILGRLRHPNIAQVYEAGTFDTGERAQPFFAMELVKGRPLLECCDSEVSPPGPQTGQHPRRRARRAEDPGLWHRPRHGLRRPGHDDADGHRPAHRDGALHEPGAGYR